MFKRSRLPPTLYLHIKGIPGPGALGGGPPPFPGAGAHGPLGAAPGGSKTPPRRLQDARYGQDASKRAQDASKRAQDAPGRHSGRGFGSFREAKWTQVGAKFVSYVKIALTHGNTMFSTLFQ